MSRCWREYEKKQFSLQMRQLNTTRYFCETSVLFCRSIALLNIGEEFQLPSMLMSIGALEWLP